MLLHKVPHTANLQLELRFGGVQPVHRKVHGSDTLLRFSLFFPVVAGLKVPGWREVEVEHLQDSPGESSDINVYPEAHSLMPVAQSVWKADCSVSKTMKLTGDSRNR